MTSYSANIQKSEFYMPNWPTLFPLFLHYKREAPYPHGGGDSDLTETNELLVNDIAPRGLKSRELYFK